MKKSKVLTQLHVHGRVAITKMITSGRGEGENHFCQVKIVMTR